MRRLVTAALALLVVVAASSALWRYARSDRALAELRVLEVYGDVRVGTGGEGRPAAEGQRLAAADRLTTGGDARAVLALNGDSRIRVGPASSVVVKDVSLEGVSLELEDGALTAIVRPESGALRVGSRGREVVATHGEFAVGVSGAVLQVDARDGAVVLSGVDVTRVEAGQQAIVVDRHAEIAAVPEALLLAVEGPGGAPTREDRAVVSGVTAPGARVEGRGRFGSRRGRAGDDGRFAVEVPLVEGDNDVEVVAVDPLGQETLVAGALAVRDTTGPTFRAGGEPPP